VKKVDVVIGLNYGDEGKGHTVDYLVHETYPHANTAVVRFNGGAQAGHTVKVDDKRHIFQHIGSGAFLGAPTILSRFFVVNPILFMQEREKFTDYMSFYVDPRCYVTTPYDVLINRLREKRNKHGSVGVGFAETIARTYAGATLLAGDLQHPWMVERKLKKIRKYYNDAVLELGQPDRPDITPEWLKGTETRFLADVKDFLRLVTIIPDTAAMKWFDHLVFEGAQGLRLDQYSEDFPHVTRSSTGLENVSVLLADTECVPDVYYVTRSYLTRHGFGPLDNEVVNPGIVDETNITNQYQDHLRFATHDFERMADDVSRDKAYMPNCNFVAVITWMDEGRLNGTTHIPLISNILAATGADYCLSSWGPDRGDIL
jgi:adenylosuccinate synthase